MEAISARGLKKSYAGAVVLSGVDLVADEGSRWTVYGPTGAGKTTLLYIIAGLVKPDAGYLDILGRQVQGNGSFVPPEARSVGMVFQKALLWPHMRVAANVEFALYPLQLPRSERKERAIEALELFGVAELARRRPETLSGGQAQRVALARSVAARPSILLWDEPFTGLDDETRREVAGRALEYIRETLTTLIMVSHRHEDASALEAGVLVLRGGSLAEGQ